MARLPLSGPLSFQQINAEFRRGTTMGAYRGVRHDAGVFPDSNLAFSNFYGRLAAFAYAHTTAGAEAWDLYEFSRANGWDGVAPLIATFTVQTGAVVRGNANAAAITAYGFPAGSDVTLINNGWIVGFGGRGGLGDGINMGGGPGNTAFYTRAAITIYNFGIIGGGGGGGRSAPLLDGNVSCFGGGGASYGPPNGGFGPGPGEGGNAALTRRFGPGNGGLNPGATRGGNGGGWGLPGEGWIANNGTGPYEVGGSAGPAIDGAAYCAFAASGDIRGAVF